MTNSTVDEIEELEKKSGKFLRLTNEDIEEISRR